MCGISGFYNLSLNAVNQEVLDTMIKQQHHRGPDSHGKYYGEYIGLAHNRLSLLDLSERGAQPFRDSEDVLVYNGEIYNFKEVKKDLPDQNFKSTSDTEVLWKALKAWGIEKTLERIEGMFAFAWYNIKTKRLVLARDRIGIKPLFFGIDKGNTLWFASEAKAFMAVTEFEPDPVKMMYSTMGVLEKSWNYTAWKGVETLSPGHYLEIENGSINKKKYFGIEQYVNEGEYDRLNGKSRSEVTDEFEHLFNKCVKKLLVSDAPVGAFVSGGIDSSLIGAYGCKNHDDLTFFTANVLGALSEFEGAKRLSNHLNKELFDYPFKKEEALEGVTGVTWHYEVPITTHFNAIPFSKVSSLARRERVKAVLTGEGSDELFLGYPRLLTSRYDNLIKAPYHFIDAIYSRLPKLGNYVDKNKGSGGLSGIFELATQRYTRQMIRKSAIKAYDFLPEKNRELHYLSAQMLQEGIIALLWRNDRMGMMHSIESRFPFLDEEMLAFAVNLPVKFKIGRTSKFYNYKHPFMIDKWIVRNLAKRTLPSDLVWKKKNGFPTQGWREIKTKPSFFYNGTVADIFGLNKAELDHMVENSSTYHIGLLTSFEIWAKLFVEKQGVENVNSTVQDHLSYV